jgi:peptide/nickel transport system permease protein
MLAFIIRRMIQSVVVMFFVALLAFAMFRFVGDPVHQMVGIETSLEEREELRVKLGLRDPIIVQFGRFVGNAATLDFGISYQHQRPVSEMIK